MHDADNPLLQPWTAPYGLPPFARIAPAHFAPAFDAAMREHRDEIAAIGANPAPPTFANTLAALDASGRSYVRVAHVFHNLAASETSPALQEAERELAPKLAAHQQAILLDEALFARIDALHARRDALSLAPEERALLERVHLDFVRAGARLAPAARRRAAAIAERLAALTTTFRQNVLHDEATQGLHLTDGRDLAGLPAWLAEAAAEAARLRGERGGWFVSLSRSVVAPFLAWSDRRDLRERAFRLWTRPEGPTPRPFVLPCFCSASPSISSPGPIAYANFSSGAAGPPTSASVSRRPPSGVSRIPMLEKTPPLPLARLSW